MMLKPPEQVTQLCNGAMLHYCQLVKQMIIFHKLMQNRIHEL